MNILERVAHDRQRCLEDDACRWRFMSEHWHSLMGGIPLHLWIAEQALRLGGVTAALDHAMDYHYSSERHIAGPEGERND